MDPVNVSDKELVDRIKSGQREAYYFLFNRYWESMYAFAQSLIRDPDTSKDILQDVWLSFWERRRQIDNQNIKAYLMQAVRFRVYKEFRDGKLRPEHIEYISTLASPDALESPLEQEELQEQIAHWVEKLPPKRREVFKLSRYEHLSNKEIAQKLNISQRTVETHISHALKFLRERLGTLAFLILFFE